MTDRSPSELEREAEQVRAEINETTRQLRDKISPGQLMDEALGYFKHGDAQHFLGNFKHQVRDNPLALALVGSGLAWLMAGQGVSSATSGSARSDPSGFASDVASSVGDSISTARDAVSNAAGSMGDTAGAAGQYARETMHDLRDHAHDIGQATADLGAKARNTFFDALEREPLVVGALGIAVGAAIGAMIPATRTEDKYLAPAGRMAVNRAETLMAEGVKRAKDVAGDVYSAARDEADRQGLAQGKEPVLDSVSAVARAAGEELAHAAHDTLRPGEQEGTAGFDDKAESPHSTSRDL